MQDDKIYLKIVGDGTRKGTAVIDKETGREVAKITRIEYWQDWNDGTYGQPYLTITVLKPEMDVEAALEDVQAYERLLKDANA